MKKISLILLAVLGLFMVHSCDDDLLDIEENFDFEVEFLVDTDAISFDASQTVDLANDVNLIYQYGDKIKEIIIEEITFWLKDDFTGNEEQMLNGGVLRVTDPDDENWLDIVNMSDVLLHELVEEPTELDFEQAGVNKLGNLAAEHPHKFTLDFAADFNEAPLYFTMVFKFKAKMVANPLN